MLHLSNYWMNSRGYPLEEFTLIGLRAGCHVHPDTALASTATHHSLDLTALDPMQYCATTDAEDSSRSSNRKPTFGGFGRCPQSYRVWKTDLPRSKRCDLIADEKAFLQPTQDRWHAHTKFTGHLARCIHRTIGSFWLSTACRNTVPFAKCRHTRNVERESVRGANAASCKCSSDLLVAE